jgi:hypothetical protein
LTLAVGLPILEYIDLTSERFIMIKTKLLVVASLVVLLFSGCATRPMVNVTPPLDIGKAPVPQSGYVAASTVTDEKHRPGSGIALGLVNTATHAEHLLPIGTLSFAEAFQDLNNVPRVIAIPPGQYRVAFWVTHYGNSGNCELMTKTIIPTNSPNSLTFSIAPNSVTFIGSYSTSASITSNGSTRTTNWILKQNPISERDARKSISSVHSDFLRLDFFCPRCAGEDRSKR